MSISASRFFSTPSPLLRSQQILRVTRTRASMLRLLFLILLGCLSILGITWKNIEFKRVSINLTQSKHTLVQLNKEQAQLFGEIKSLASYPRIATWANKERGWTIASTPPRKIILSRQDLSTSAQNRWDILRAHND